MRLRLGFAPVRVAESVVVHAVCESTFPVKSYHGSHNNLFDKEMKIPKSALIALKKAAVKAVPQIKDFAIDLAKREAKRFLNKKLKGRR